MPHSSKTKIVFLVGFDRCGSSLVAKLLAKHPKINLLFQPFNRTEIQRTQLEIWSPDKRAAQTEAFIDGLLKGFLDKNYLESGWVYKHSSSLEIDAKKINLIKDTKFHFKTEWLNFKYPEVDFWGIWRDPRGIVCSLMRNDFYQKWYGEKDFMTASKVILKHPILKPYRYFLKTRLNDTEKMALLVAVRTHYMASSLSSNKCIVYEDILADANKALGSFFDKYKLSKYDMSKYIHEDANVIGQPFEKSDLWKDFFPKSQLKKLNNIFQELFYFCPHNTNKLSFDIS